MNILILYFSGTGNTEVLSETLMNSFLALDHNATCLSIESPSLNTVITGSEWDLIGLGYPVHAFNAPLIIYDTIKTFVPKVKTQDVFLFYTAGGPTQLNDASTLKLRRALSSLNYKVVGEKGFYLSANMIVRYPDSIIHQLFNASQKAAFKFAKDLISNKATLFNTALFFRIISWMGLLEQIGARDFGKSLRVESSCTGCGLCISSCPSQNIAMIGNRFIFKNRCIFCMRCIYSCPKMAIRSKWYSFFVLKDFYNIKNILQKNDPSTDPAILNPNKKQIPERITEKTRGYYGIFKKYLRENDAL